MHPILFRTDLFTLHTLWIFISIGIVFSTFWLIKLCIKNRLKIQFITQNSWKLIIASLLSARIFFVLTNLNIYFAEINLDSFINTLKFWDLGLSIWGAIIGGLLMLRHLTRKYERNLIKWLDVFVPTIILGLAFFHLGAFFDGTNYGLPTELPWGIVFENYEIKYIGAIHPSQIYALLYSLLTFILLYFINSTKKIQEYPKPGFIATLGVAAYSLFYFLEQFTRGDDTMTIFGDVRVPQIFAFAIFVFATYKLYKNYKTVLRSEQ